MCARYSTSESSNVYFIQGVDGGPIKIGRTVGPAEIRLASIQTCTPVKLKLLGEINQVPSHYEKAIHRKFEHLHRRGEWYEPGPDLLEFISRYAQVGRCQEPLEGEDLEGSIETLRALSIVDLKATGWTSADIMALLGISRTVYDRLVIRSREISPPKSKAKRRGRKAIREANASLAHGTSLAVDPPICRFFSRKAKSRRQADTQIIGKGKQAIPPILPLVVGRRGRPRCADQPKHRQRHIRVAFEYLVKRRTARDVAQEFMISDFTVRNWSKLALTYDDAEAEGLHRMVAAQQDEIDA